MADLQGQGQLVAPGTIRFERNLPGPVTKAWAFLVESDKRAQWLAGGSIEPRVGGRVELRFRHDELSPRRVPLPERFSRYEAGSVLLGTVTAFEPPRLLAFTWQEGSEHPSEVIFEFAESGTGTRLILTHRRLTETLAELANVSAGWHTHLGILTDRLAGNTPEPFFASFEDVEAEYAAVILPARSRSGS